MAHLAATDPDVTARLERLEHDLTRGLDRSLRLFGFALAAIGAVITVLAFVLGAAVFQAYRVSTDLKQEVARVEQTMRVLPYRAAINSAVEIFRQGTATDRRKANWDQAVWTHLLKTLHATKMDPIFFDVALEFRRVLPYLKLDVDTSHFRDSYRGQIWICIELLESDIPDVVESVLKIMPPMARLRAIAADPQNVAKLDPTMLVDFRESIERLERAVKASQ